jgi:triosephosphate isomerase
MNGLRESVSVLNTLRNLLEKGNSASCDVIICPPFPLLFSFCQESGDQIAIGGQDCHQHPSGAYTGDISAEMIKDTGAQYVIIGHSERRAGYGESSELIAEKAQAAFESGLFPIICVGETEAERDAGKTLDVVLEQVARSIPEGASADNLIIAYEPVWAIGTGRTPTVGDIAQVHGAIRERLIARFKTDGVKIPILYGGSVKPSNANELMAVEDVNGALVGGASLKAEDLNGIIDAYRK